MKIVKLALCLLMATGLMLLSQQSQARHAAILVDADNGNVLYELEASQSWYPASLTKMMTLYMAFSALESGRLRLSQSMYVSKHAARQPTSKLGLRTWETITVEDAILAIITRSANDAAVVLAEQMAGSEQQFAIKMTSVAHQLGMYGSHFMNATGLPHDWQTTTAHDMGLLAWKIIRDFPQYYSYFQADSLYFNGREYRATNKFVAYYPGAEGMKTGYTCGSGYNLVATANQNGQRLIGVVLGGLTSGERYDLMFDLMDLGFSSPYLSYRTKNIQTMSGNAVGTPPYQLSCGHRPSSHHAAWRDEDEDDRHVRYVKKTKHAAHLAAAPKHEERRPITKIKIAGKTKTIVKDVPEQRVAAKSNKKNRGDNVKTSKLDRKTKIAVTVASKKAAQVTTKKNKAGKPVKPIQVAANKPKGKGYYTPSDTKKTTTKAKVETKKSKGYYRPDAAVKTAAKTTKSKRGPKSKS